MKKITEYFPKGDIDIPCREPPRLKLCHPLRGHGKADCRQKLVGIGGICKKLQPQRESLNPKP